MPQEVMVVEVFVSQGDAGDALRDQRAHRVLRQTRIAPVREAGGHPVEQPDIERSVPRSNRAPPFEVIEPPSNAAITFLPPHP